jgi:hypothetical protein
MEPRHAGGQCLDLLGAAERERCYCRASLRSFEVTVG